MPLNWDQPNHSPGAQLGRAVSRWELSLKTRTNPNDDITTPTYGFEQVLEFRTRAEARKFIADFTAEKGLQLSSAVPSRHGILCEPGARGTARYSYGIRSVTA